MYRKGPRKRSRWLNYLATWWWPRWCSPGPIVPLQVTVGGGDAACAAVVAVATASVCRGRPEARQNGGYALYRIQPGPHRPENEVRMEYPGARAFAQPALEHTSGVFPGETDVARGTRLTEGETDIGRASVDHRLYGRIPAPLLRQRGGSTKLCAAPDLPADALDARYSDELDYTTIRVNAVQHDG